MKGHEIVNISQLNFKAWMPGKIMKNYYCLTALPGRSWTIRLCTLTRLCRWKNLQVPNPFRNFSFTGLCLREKMVASTSPNNSPSTFTFDFSLSVQYKVTSHPNRTSFNDHNGEFSISGTFLFSNLAHGHINYVIRVTLFFFTYVYKFKLQWLSITDSLPTRLRLSVTPQSPIKYRTINNEHNST